MTPERRLTMRITQREIDQLQAIRTHYWKSEGKLYNQSEIVRRALRLALETLIGKGRE